jgi:hypothetical protein
VHNDRISRSLGFIPLCEAARTKGVRPSNVKAAWKKVGVHPWSPKAVLEDPEAQSFLWVQDELERRRQAARTGHPMTLRSDERLSELQKLTATPEVREGPSPVRQLATFALENEAMLAVTKQRLNKALATGEPAPTSRKVLSRSRHATRRDLLTARHARQYAESGGRIGKGKGKGKWAKAPKTKAGKHPADEYTVRADESEVERQVEEILRREEEEEAEELPEADFGIDEDDIPEAESSAEATRRGPARGCKRG